MRLYKPIYFFTKLFYKPNNTLFTFMPFFIWNKNIGFISNINIEIDIKFVFTQTFFNQVLLF